MKLNLIKFLFPLLFILLPLHSQWRWQHPLPQGSQVNCYYKYTDDIHFIGTEAGTIFKSTDSGSTWVLKSTGWSASRYVYDIKINEDGIGFATTWSSMYYKTTDFGETWATPQYVSAPMFDNSDSHLEMYNKGEFFAWVTDNIGPAKYYFTKDNGETWNKRYFDTKVERLRFITDSIAIAAGNGIWGSDAIKVPNTDIYRTTDKGNSWTRQSFSDFDAGSVTSIHVDPKFNILIGTSKSRLFSSADKGESWIEIPINEFNTKPELYNENIYAVKYKGVIYFYRRKTNEIFSSNDLGNTWQKITYPSIEVGVKKTHLEDDGNWYFYGDGIAVLNLNTMEYKNLTSKSYGGYEIDFVNENIGFLNTWKEIYKTTDRGESWTVLENLVAGRGMDFVNENIGVISNTIVSGSLENRKYENQFWLTKNSGISSELIHNNENYYAYDTKILNDTIIISVGYNNVDSVGVIIRKDGLSANAEVTYFNFDSRLWNIFLVEPNHIWIVGENGTVIKSSDKGANWTELESNVQSALYKVYFLNENLGWIVGALSGDYLETNNGGESWERKNFSYYVNSTYGGIYFSDSLNGWIAQNPVFQTTDGGNSWNTPEESKLTRDFLNDMFFVNGNLGWIVTENGILKYENADGNSDPVRITYPLDGSIVRSDEAVYLRWEGAEPEFIDIEYSSNSGKTWDKAGQNIPSISQSIYFEDIPESSDSSVIRILDSNGQNVIDELEKPFIVGHLSVLDKVAGYFTYEGDVYYFESGNTLSFSWRNSPNIKKVKVDFAHDNILNEWIPIDTVIDGSNKINWEIPYGIESGNYLFKVSYLNHPELYDYLDLQIYILGIPSDIDEDAIPIEFSLSQNFPNPFNPQTKIIYDVPKTSLVVLSIYNILGQKVRMLVNDIKVPGKYEVALNAATLASGVYFYRMEAGDYVDVKKMILMK